MELLIFSFIKYIFLVTFLYIKYMEFLIFLLKRKRNEYRKNMKTCLEI